jgi:hypothetical protein
MKNRKLFSSIFTDWDRIFTPIFGKIGGSKTSKRNNHRKLRRENEARNINFN